MEKQQTLKISKLEAENRLWKERVSMQCVKISFLEDELKKKQNFIKKIETKFGATPKIANELKKLQEMNANLKEKVDQQDKINLDYQESDNKLSKSFIFDCLEACNYYRFQYGGRMRYIE